jgi:hypothetical protein
MAKLADVYTPAAAAPSTAGIVRSAVARRNPSMNRRVATATSHASRSITRPSSSDSCSSGA